MKQFDSSIPKIVLMIVTAVTLLVIAISLTMTMTSCESVDDVEVVNRQLLDTTYAFDRAIISLPDGTTVSGKCESWCDYDNDTIQVVINGTTYYTSFNNVVLIHSGENSQGAR